MTSTSEQQASTAHPYRWIGPTKLRLRSASPKCRGRLAAQIAWVASLLIAGLLPSAARAQSTETWSPGTATTSKLPGQVEASDDQLATDGVYGRFDGDLDLALSAGAEFEASSQRGLARASAHYYWMAGVYGSYRQAFGASKRELAADQLASLGVDMRPMFIPRWSLDFQSGPPLLDLVLDSFSFAGGAFFTVSSGVPRAARRGFEASVGFGFPLLAQAEGPWLAVRGLMRWPESGASVRGLWLLFEWHLLVNTPLAATTGAVH